MRRPAAIVALTLAAVVLFTASPVSSLVAAVEVRDLTLLPGTDSSLDAGSGDVRVSVQPGGGVWQTAIVTNRGRQRFTVRLAGSEWVHPAVESVLLEPGQSETVRFTVAPPVDARPGEAQATLVAEVDGQPDARRTLEVVVTVLAGVSPTPIENRSDGDALESEPRAAPPDNASREPASAGDTFLLVSIVGAVSLLLLGLFVPPALRAFRQRRALRIRLTQAHARVLSRIDARRIRRIVDAAAAIGEMPPMIGKPTRADVKRAITRRRAVERRKIVRAEEARVRDESRRFATSLWSDRIRAARERTERERAERAERIAAARREQTELAAALAAARQAEEARRRERLRQSEEERRSEHSRRAQERTEGTTTRRSEGRAAARRAAAAARDRELERQRRAESERNQHVHLRSHQARNAAVAWGGAMDAARRAQAARTPPVPGEDGTRPPPELAATVAFLDPLTGTVVRPERPPRVAAEPSTVGPSGPGDRLDVTALDVEELNRQLASAPSQGTRAASAQRRSSP